LAAGHDPHGFRGPDGRDLGGATWKLNDKVEWTTEAHKAQDQ